MTLREGQYAIACLTAALEDIEQRWGPQTATLHSGLVVGGAYDILLFEQLWGSTALGFPGLGCAAMTTAPTVIISERPRAAANVAAVYFGRRHAYDVRITDRFHEALTRWYMPAQEDAAEQFGDENITLPLSGSATRA